MGLTELKNHLRELKHETLVKQIAELYRKYEPVKEHYDLYLTQNENELLKLYKQRIREYLRPQPGEKTKEVLAEKAIREFKKPQTSIRAQIELRLFFVECGVRYSIKHEGVSDNYCIGLVNQFQIILDLLAKNNLLDEFEKRALRILNQTYKGYWEFYHYIFEIYNRHYETTYLLK
jgi:regulator of replication initiation timing